MFFVQLILFWGKFHIQKKRWANSKPNIEHFHQKLHQYGTTRRNIEKAIKTNYVFDKNLMDQWKFINLFMYIIYINI